MNNFEHVQRPGVWGGSWEGCQCGKGAKARGKLFPSEHVWTCRGRGEVLHLTLDWPMISWVVVIWRPTVIKQTDRHDWKHYLPTTSLAGGNQLKKCYLDMQPKSLVSYCFPENRNLMEIISQRSMLCSTITRLRTVPCYARPSSNTLRVEYKCQETFSSPVQTIMPFTLAWHILRTQL